MTPDVHWGELADKTGLAGVFAIYFAVFILATAAIPAFLEGAIATGVIWLAVVAALTAGGSLVVARWFRARSA